MHFMKLESLTAHEIDLLVCIRAHVLNHLIPTLMGEL